MCNDLDLNDSNRCTARIIIENIKYIMLGELTNIQIQNILTSQVIGRIGCTDGMQPYIVPVTFTYDGKYIYGQSNEGKKMKILRKNPKVCFEVDVMTDMRNWQSVLLFGIFEELTL